MTTPTFEGFECVYMGCGVRSRPKVLRATRYVDDNIE